MGRPSDDASSSFSAAPEYWILTIRSSSSILADSAQLSRAALEKAAQAAIRADKNKAEPSARDWGYRIGNEIYDSYLRGKVATGSLRRLFLAHLDQAGVAQKVCAAVIARLRSAARGSQIGG